MPLTLIIGPMKSGKTLELFKIAKNYKNTKHNIGFYDPTINTRDKNITSRAGISIASKKIKRLADIKNPPNIIVIDEIHMFDPKDILQIDKWLKDDHNVYLSGLDLDYRGKTQPTIIKILELKPDNIIIKKAICDVCKSSDAIYTQILKDNIPVKKGLPSVVPENNLMLFQARCRRCFINK